MGSLTTGIRRSLWLVLIAAAGGALWAWRRDAADASPPGPAEWPPLTTAKSPPTAPDPATSSIVHALVDAPEARSTDRGIGGWAEPLADGSCPANHPIKANENSGIFHVPGGRFYDRTRAVRCYSDADAAVADGYRRAKN